MRARYSCVVRNPLALSHSDASAYRCSGRSPRVNRASVHPRRWPARATDMTSSTVRYRPPDSSGDCRKVQYPQKSRQRRVNGMNTFGEKVITRPRPRSRNSDAAAHRSATESPLSPANAMASSSDNAEPAATRSSAAERNLVGWATGAGGTWESAGGIGRSPINCKQGLPGFQDKLRLRGADQRMLCQDVAIIARVPIPDTCVLKAVFTLC